PDMGYRASVIAQFRIGLYAAPAYLAACGGSPAAPAELSAHDLVGSREFVGAAQLTLTDRRGRSQEVIARPVIRTSDYGGVLRLTVAGGGIGPIPDRVAAASVAAGALVPVLPEWSVSEGRLYAISLSGR